MSAKTPSPVSLILRTSRRGRHELVLRQREIMGLVVAVVAVLLVARFWGLDSRPGLEWDEPVYTSVAHNLMSSGEIAVKAAVGSSGLYLYHPPFYFHLLAAWFELLGPSVEAARLLSVFGSLAMLAGLAVMVRRYPGGRSAWLLLAVLALDGWVVFTNRISLIENLMLPIGVAALAVYQWSSDADRSRRQRAWGFVAAGLLLGAAAVFKHTGLYLLAVPAIHYLIVRRHGRDHLRLVVAASAVLVGYVVGMAAVFGAEFWAQYRIQLLRSLGLVESRGSVELGDLLLAALGTYLPFVITVIAASLSVALVVFRLGQALRARSLDRLRGPSSLYFSWALAGLVSFGLLGLRLPQYFILVFIPLFLYAGSELVVFLRRRYSGEYAPLVFALALAGVVVLNGVGLVFRMVLANDNALRDVSAFVASNYDSDVLVLADEPVGVSIPQPYLQLDSWATDPASPTPDVVVIITSLTQQLPPAARLEALLASAEEVFAVSGFKEQVRVFEVRPRS